jgi:hypothetical protein
LWDFLLQIRDHKEWNRRWFWIDAICINQQDTRERNTQVSIMRQIYATAENVVVWLGPATEKTNLAMDYITQHNIRILQNKIPERWRPQMKPVRFHTIWTEEEGKAFLNLCRKGYWKQVWIVQEIMCARRIVLFCGWRNVQWRMIDGIFQRLKSIQVMGWLHMHSYGPEVLESEAALIFGEKRRERHPLNKEKGPSGIIRSTRKYRKSGQSLRFNGIVFRQNNNRLLYRGRDGLQ